MNKIRTRTKYCSAVHSAGYALAAALLLGLAACSGGGGGSRPTFALFSVDPNESPDVNGGDDVVVHGRNFLAAKVTRVTFGDGNPGFNMTVLDDERIQVTVPPSPTGNPAIVTVEVETQEFGIKGLFGAFTYKGDGGGGGPPKPQTIFPTTFTPTGAQGFTIQGTDLGPANGTVTVQFAGVGPVVANVNSDSTIVTGRAPVSMGVPPAGPLQVTVDNNGELGDVPTQVSYAYAAPQAFIVGNQENLDNASRPVRVKDDLAIMATAGPNVAWADGNDDLFLISGPPGVPQVRSILSSQPTASRYLDRNNSIPVVLNEDTVCVFSPGPTPALGDEVILLITNLAAPAPTVQLLPAANAASIPLGRISANRIGFILRGTGTGGQDQLQIYTIVSGIFQGALPAAINVNFADPAGLAGRKNFSIPFSPDGDAVFVFSSGINGTFFDNDDQVYRYVISTSQTSFALTRQLLTQPVALSASRVAALSTGAVVTPADFDDQLAYFDFAAGGTVTTTHIDLNAKAETVMLRPIVRLGDKGVVLVTGGPDINTGNSDDLVAVFTDDGSGGFNRANASLQQRPAFARLGNGDVVAFSRGGDGVLKSGDDRAVRILADGSGLADFTAPVGWGFGVAPLSDAERVFVPEDGFDQIPTTGDEELIVFQTANLGRGNDTCVLPLSVDLNSPIQGNAFNPVVFVPVGPGWGVMQSPGPNKVWLGPDDRIVIVQY